MKNAKEYLSLFLAVVAAGSMVFGWLFWVDDRYAKTRHLVALEVKVSIAEVKDTLREALENLYFYRKQNKAHPNDTDIKERLDEAEEEVRELKEQLKELKEKKNERQ